MTLVHARALLSTEKISYSKSSSSQNLKLSRHSMDWLSLRWKICRDIKQHLASQKFLTDACVTCRHYPDLGSILLAGRAAALTNHHPTQIWVVLLIGLSKFSPAGRPIRNSTVVATHLKYGISALDHQTSFRGETSCGNSKCRRFSKAVKHVNWCYYHNEADWSDAAIYQQ